MEDDNDDEYEHASEARYIVRNRKKTTPYVPSFRGNKYQEGTIYINKNWYQEAKDLTEYTIAENLLGTIIIQRFFPDRMKETFCRDRQTIIDKKKLSYIILIPLSL